MALILNCIYADFNSDSSNLEYTAAVAVKVRFTIQIQTYFWGIFKEIDWLMNFFTDKIFAYITLCCMVYLWSVCLLPRVELTAAEQWLAIFSFFDSIETPVKCFYNSMKWKHIWTFRSLDRRLYKNVWQTAKNIWLETSSLITQSHFGIPHYLRNVNKGV